MISIAAKFTVDALKQCLERGCKWVTIVPGGFRETGTKEGIETEVWVCSLCHMARTKSVVWPKNTTAELLDLTAWECLIPVTWIPCLLVSAVLQSPRLVMLVFSLRVEPLVALF